MNQPEKRDRVLKEALACQPALTAYAHSILSDFPAAQDVVQNAYVVVARKFDDFEEGTSILAWCRAIVRLQAMAWIRKNRREQLIEDRILQEAIESAFLAQQTGGDTAVRLDSLRECLQQLPGRGQEMIGLRYEQNSSYQQIADALGQTLEAIRKSLYRTKQQLANCVRLRMEAANRQA